MADILKFCSYAVIYIKRLDVIMYMHKIYLQLY